MQVQHNASASSPSPSSVESSSHRQRRHHHAAAWVGTQLRVVAVTGLASSHSAPFTRVIYQIPSSTSRGTRSTNKKNKSQVVCLDNQVSRECRRRLRREQNGRYTAIWGNHSTHGSADREVEDDGDFLLLPSLEYLEIQVWNQFPNGFDVFLGMATLAISSLYQQQQQLQQQDPVTHVLETPLMWIPLQVSDDKENNTSATHNAAIAQMNLSVQLQVCFLRDTKSFRVCQQVSQRSQRDKKTTTNDPAQSFADPAFAFTKPFHAIDWSAVVSTSVRHIFFHADVDRLSSFKDQVLYGDLLQELQEDEGLHVHDDHLSAFQLSQLSAQYLSHCVDTLSTRCEEYSGQYRVLAEMRSKLFKTRSQLKRQRDRLKKESDGLDLLLSTYRSIADKDKLDFSQTQEDNENQELSARDPLSLRGNSPSRQPPLRSSSFPLKLTDRDEHPPSSPDPLVSQKPALLMTWEERERERKLEKERSKPKRIKEEKQRLEQVTKDRRSREEHQLRLSNLIERGRHRAATTMQRFFRHKLANFKLQQAVKARIAAVTIQSQLRGYFCRMKVIPKAVEERRCARELDLMAQNEREMRKVLRSECEREIKLHAELQTDDQEQQYHHGSPMLSPLASPLLKQDVNALVSMYRKLRRIFLLAYHQHAIEDGSAYQSLFAKLDLRQDGVLDRAEFRLGIRNFGVRIDRKLMRALIALVRAKCGAQPQPLHLSLDQFVRGFDLPVHNNNIAVSSNLHTEGGRRTQKARQEPQSPITPQESKDDQNDDNDDDESPNGEVDQIAIVSQAVENLRVRILDAAKSHLEAQGKQISNYHGFRDALTFVFEEFDVDNNGELDLDELVACIEAINFQVTKENLALLRDCFACDDDNDDGKISIPEFISFALAGGGGGGSAGLQQTEENLGIVGSRLREAVLERIRVARKQTETIEDAVRFVFRRAYPRKDQQSCAVPIFMKALLGLKLPAKSAQLARLVVKLDKDGDHSISFDELLLWLRLRSASELAARRKNSGTEELSTTNVRVRRHSHIVKASATAKLVRSVLHELAGLPTDINPSAKSSSSMRSALTQMFGKIDRDGSGKVTREEIRSFLAAQDPTWPLNTLNAPGGRGGTDLELTDPDLIPIVLADAIMNTIDLNRNGVGTLDEWLEFLEQTEVSGGSQGGDHQTDRFALINSVRTLLLEAVKEDEADLNAWFHGLPGALPAAPVSGGAESQTVIMMKVRANVFKTALRAKLGAKSISMPLQAIDEVVKRLDSDSSGWITTLELQNWAFPIRDLEELLRAITSRWRIEEDQYAPDAKKEHEADFALALYSRFDADGNGILAQREIRGGFASFGLQFKIEEIAALTKAFDLDQDGCWSKAEFLAFVYTLFPHAIFPKSSHPAGEFDAETAATQDYGESDAGAVVAKAGDREEDAGDGDEDNYDREVFFSSHSSSSASSSTAARSSSSLTGDASQLLSSPTSSTAGSKATEYSQEFD